MIERDIERRLGTFLRGEGCLYMKWTSPGTIGVPDRIVITSRGEVIFVELKQDHGALTPAQSKVIRWLRARNAEVWVVYGWKDAEVLIERVKRGYP